VSKQVHSDPYSFAKFFHFAIVLLLLTGSVACGPDPSIKAAEVSSDTGVPDPAHNSRISLDWPGTYRGTLPCADCVGIKTKLTLYDDDTYRRTIEYVGRNERVFTDEGSFRWSETGNKISIDNLDGSRQNYLPGEGFLVHLDRRGEPITGTRANLYKLMKNFADPLIENIRWAAFEIDGHEMQVAAAGKQAFILLNSNNGAISGYDGCNAIRGEYELNARGSISLLIKASTKMACPDMKSTDDFRALLARADSYAVTDTLLLFAEGAGMPLAKFASVPSEQ
jgi:uncharacterized lipoprotein NlpE involved in copper resistance